MTMPDPYKILQVDSEAEHEVIEAAYRRLARKYHPDVSPDPESQARMVAINQAWEQLREPLRRAAVDRARSRAASAAARVTAADAHVRTAGREGHAGREGTPGYTASHAPGAAGPAPTGPSPRPAAWPVAGMRDPSDGEAAGPRAERVSRDWTSGRSTAGGGYNPSTMGSPQGHGSAGPPPGNPSGSVLNFGRYAGWSLSEIARKDLEYLEWLDRMPIGRSHQHEIDALLRTAGRRTSAAPQQAGKRGLFRRR